MNIPKSIIEIGVDAFAGDVKLKPIDLPEGLKHIEQDALWYCAIDSIVFPASLEYLGGGSCANWKYIKKIYSLAPIPPYCAEDMDNPGDGPFHGYTPNDVPLYVPIGSGEKYRQAFGWNYFTNIIETDKFPTGIVSPKMGNNEPCKVYGRDGKLVIETPQKLSAPIHYVVYAVNGQVVAQGTLATSYSLSTLAKGIYIVRIGNTIHKVRL